MNYLYRWDTRNMPGNLYKWSVIASAAWNFCVRGSLRLWLQLYARSRQATMVGWWRWLVFSSSSSLSSRIKRSVFVAASISRAICFTTPVDWRRAPAYDLRLAGPTTTALTEAHARRRAQAAPPHRRSGTFVWSPTLDGSVLCDSGYGMAWYSRV